MSNDSGNDTPPLREPVVVRAYRALLRLLPPSVRAEDGTEMVATFAAMWRDAEGGRRLRCLIGSFGRVPVVALAEWREGLMGSRHVGRIRGLTGEYARLGGWADMDGVIRIVRQAARGLRRTPAFSASTVLLLGLGVGAVTTIFTLVDHVLLRPLPYPSAERLFTVENGSHSGLDWRYFQEMPSVEAWAAASSSEVNLTGDGEPLRLTEARVTDGFFTMFGARPSAGRLFVPDDYAAADVVVLSTGAWERLFGRDPGVVGRTLRVDDVPLRVVGVTAASFVSPEALLDREEPDLWRPQDFADPGFENPGYHVLGVAGRLAPGATLEDARRDAQAVAERRAREIPEHYVDPEDGSLLDLPVVSLQESTVGSARQGLGLLLGAVGLLLLVACANVAHLFMARGIARGREMAVRRALGAGTRALAGLLLSESLLVALAGAAVGITLAAAALQAFLAASPESLPRLEAVGLDLRVFAFAVVLASLTALAFGLLPALRVARGDPGEALRAGGRGNTGSRSTRLARGGLVVAEVALSLVLVAQAGLLLSSFAKLHDEPLGFRVEEVWTLPVRISGSEEDPVAGLRRLEAIRESLAAVPGVQAATFGLSVPLEYTGGNRCCWSTRRTPPGASGSIRVALHSVAEDWSNVFEPRLVAGGWWTPDEAMMVPPPAVANEALAVAEFGSAADAVGRELDFGDDRYRVVGVTAEDRHYGVDQDHGAALYLPMSAPEWSLDEGHMAVLVDGAAGAGADLPRRLREAVWRIEPDVPVPTVRSMESWLAEATAGTRFDSLLFSAFGAVALLLAAGGLYGTLLYTVGMERRELGIRLALGAARRRIEGRVLGRGLGLAAAGAVLGTIGAWASGELLRSRLFGVEPGDPTTLAGSAAVLLLTAALACWLPARRAAATDPLETLREE